MSRTPNLKLIGGSICIQANISHTIEKLQINPENIIINETEINDEIDIMSDRLISELVSYDEYRVLKDQLDEKKVKLQKM